MTWIILVSSILDPQVTTDLTAPAETSLSLSQPVFAYDEIHFSAFGLGWGFCSHAIPVALVVTRIGAANSFEQQPKFAFQINRQRITQAVVEAGSQEAGKRVILKTV
jgi:hypothetical protein